MLEPTHPKTDCHHCRLAGMCFPSKLKDEEIIRFEGIVKHKRPLKTGEHLFRQEDQANSLYFVKSGSFRSTILESNGESQMVDFYFPGEIMGLDGLQNGRFHCSVAALETATVCELDYSHLSSMCAALPNLQAQFMRIIGSQITTHHDRITLLANQSAAAKLAAFLLMLSKRYSALGYSSAEFNLTMDRYDIASFLNMAIETLSRQLATLRESGIISVKNRNIHINNLELLKLVA